MTRGLAAQRSPATVDRGADPKGMILDEPSGPRPGAGGRSIVRLALLLLIPVLFLSCQGKSDKEIIAAMFDDMAARVENKDTAGLIAHLAADYSDFAGRDREQTRAMAEEYFRRYRGIKIKMLSSRIAMGQGGGATAEIDVSLYSGIGAALRKAVGFSGENYRVSCVLRREGEWRVSQASWESVTLEGLFPESLKVLREIFPDL
jgi:hypothetical protein